MTRKDYYRYAKLFLLSLLVSVPLLVAFNLLVATHLAHWVLIAVNVVILLVAFFATVVLAEKRAQRIARKRQEWLKEHPEAQQDNPQTNKKHK